MYKIGSFVSLQTTKLSRYVSVAMVTEYSLQQAKAWIAVASNSKDISIFLCCYGNKVSITTSQTMDSCGLKGPVYQIRTSYTFRQQSYKHMPLLPW